MERQRGKKGGSIQSFGSPTTSVSGEEKMAAALVYASLTLSIRGVSGSKIPKLYGVSRMPTCNFAPNGASFLLVRSSAQLKGACKANAASIRCERSANEANNLNVRLGRLAMVGFAVAISIEISTGKGLLENFGLTAPLPTVALAVTALVGISTAVFISQSA